MNQETNKKYSPSYSEAEQQMERGEEIAINWGKYIYLILKNWYWFLLTLFIALGVSYIKLRYTLPTYKVTATLLIEDEQNTDDVMSQFRSIRYYRNKTELANEKAKLRAFSLHRSTVDSLNWEILWTGHGRVAAIIPLYHGKPIPFTIEMDSTTSDWYRNREFDLDIIDNSKLKLTLKNHFDTVFNANEWVNLNDWKFRISFEEVPTFASYSFIAYDPNTLARQFRNKVQFESEDEMGTIINVSSTGQIAQMEIDYVNKLCDNYIKQGLARKRLIAENTLEFIDEQIAIIRDSLQDAEAQLLAYRLNNNVIDLSMEGQIAFEQLTRLADQKNQLVFKRNYYNYLKDYIETQSDPEAIITPTLVEADDPLLLDQVSVLQELYREKEQLLFSVEPGNPELI